MTSAAIASRDSGRQWLCDQLAYYARSVDRKDGTTIGRLLGDAEVTFKQRAVPRGAESAAEFYSSAFLASDVETLHVPSMPAIDEAPDGLQYEAPYLRFVDLAGSLSLDGAGVYRGTIAHDGRRWRFVEFRVDAT